MIIDVHPRTPQFRGALPAEGQVINRAWRRYNLPATTAAEPTVARHKVNDIVGGMPFPRVPEDKLEAIIYRESLTLLGLN